MFFTVGALSSVSGHYILPHPHMYRIFLCNTLLSSEDSHVRGDSHLRLGPSQTIHGMRLMATVERRSTMMVHVSVTLVWLVVSVFPTYSVND